VGNEELNYRRFFTINGLLSVRVEHKDAFEYTHQLLWPLINAGAITGVRVDHIDGLYNPVKYLAELRRRQPELYITVEKILDPHEQLPPVMPVQGTTGYDFLNAVNSVFIDRDNCKVLDRFYTTFTGLNTPYRTLVSQKKRHFMGRFMAGDIDNMALFLKSVLNRDRHGKDMTLYALRRAIVEVMAHFPVYRSYMWEKGMSEQDRIHIKEATVRAKNENPGLVHELNMIEKILLMTLDAGMDVQDKQDYDHFVKKFQ